MRFPYRPSDNGVRDRKNSNTLLKRLYCHSGQANGSRKARPDDRLRKESESIAST